MKYQLLTITNEREKVLLDTNDEELIRKTYDPDSLQRIRIKKKMLLIFQADDFSKGKPIRKPNPPVRIKKEKKVKEAGKNLRSKAVIQIDVNGNEINRFKSVVDAANANYVSENLVSKVCNGHKSIYDLHFVWG